MICSMGPCARAVYLDHSRIVLTNRACCGTLTSSDFTTEPCLCCCACSRPGRRLSRLTLLPLVYCYGLDRLLTDFEVGLVQRVRHTRSVLAVCCAVHNDTGQFQRRGRIVEDMVQGVYTVVDSGCLKRTCGQHNLIYYCTEVYLN